MSSAGMHEARVCPPSGRGLVARRALATCVLATLVSCGRSDDQSAPVEVTHVPTRIGVTPLSAEVNQGSGVQVVAKVFDQFGLEMPDIPIAVSSADTTIITITPTLFALANGRSGATHVIVSAAGLTQTMAIRVLQVFVNVDFEDFPDSLGQFESFQLHAKPADQVHALVPGITLLFAVHPAIATVTPGGLVESTGQTGDLVVIAWGFQNGERVEGAKLLHVYAIPASLTVSSNTLTVGVGTSNTIVASVTDRLGRPIEPPPVTFESGDTTLVRVTRGGVVYAVGGQGQTQVRVRSGTLERSVAVTVGSYVRSEWNLVGSLAAPGVNSVAVSPNGSYVASGTPHPTSGWWSSLTAGTALVAAPPTGHVALDSRGLTLFVAGDAATDGVVVIDVPTGQQRGMLLAGDIVDAILVSPDDATLYVATRTRVVRAIDLATGATRWSQPLGGPPVFALNRNRLYVSRADGGIAEVDLATVAVREALPTGAFGRLAPFPDGGRLAVLRPDDPSVEVRDASSFARISRTLLSCAPADVLHAGDGRTAFVSCIDPPGLVVLDQDLTRILKVVPLSQRPWHMALSPDGKTLLVTNLGGWIDFVR